MVLEILDKALESKADSEELNPAVSQQVADIFEEAEHRAEAEDTNVKQWRYRIPFAGVRYYWY